MEQFKQTLSSREINIRYLNVNALYDDLGNDGIKLLEKPLVEHRVKYINNPLLLSIMRRFLPEIFPHVVPYHEKKYEKLSLAILNLSNYEIFVSIFEYFFDEDIMYLNMDAIYDEGEIFFSHLIQSLR